MGRGLLVGASVGDPPKSPFKRGTLSRDRLAAGLIWFAVVGVAAALCWMLWDVVGQGMGVLSWEFLTGSPIDAGRAGGIAPILVSTGLIVGVCLAVSVPLALGTAILLVEFSGPQSRWHRWVQLSLDMLAGVPSIVFGLFGNACFSKLFGLGFSILAGGLTLACMVLPILIRSTQVGLRAVPEDYRRSGAALGLSRLAVLRRVLLPMALPGIVAGLLLGIGRAIAETAALIFTSGYVDRLPSSLLDSGRAISVHIFDLAMNIPGGESMAYGSALVLVLALVGINTLVSLLADWWRRVWLGGVS
ncbi:phosphate ABC transporter permease PstA [filamentous cyanobacterium LEGE 11480]|uniref:Phosphate transport system permease protein PstA n=1 Tax=Romeriopsis navalis LEGE 11480 TaxID=2777977 RepID=A0A928VL76_9CYAN|nr:phosphate ABC transporter permease PstA [Romeriopsis navalis]MBE9028570.1 phosphate ABC transporter permease PstA [Romeriopsis navalis LEGE 11480]